MSILSRARVILASIGGLASMIAGINGHYRADAQTPKRESKRVRLGRGNYGRNLRSHFDTMGVCWSKKPNKLRKCYNTRKLA